MHFGVTLGLILASEGDFGVTLGSLWDHFGATLGSLWVYAGDLRSLWDHCGVTLGI